MTKSEEIQRDQELAERARPLIIDGLRARREPLHIAREVGTQLDVDERKAYRWVAYIAEDFERRRRRIGVTGLLMLWPGMIVLVGGPLLSLFGIALGAVSLWLLGVVVGVPLTIAGAFISFGARRLVRDST